MHFKQIETWQGVIRWVIRRKLKRIASAYQALAHTVEESNFSWFLAASIPRRVEIWLLREGNFLLHWRREPMEGNSQL